MNPWAILLLALPIAPLTPLLILGFGIGMTSRVIVVVLFCWVFIALNTRAGVRAVDPALIEMARSFDASERQVWRLILLRVRCRAWSPGCASGWHGPSPAWWWSSS